MFFTEVEKLGIRGQGKRIGSETIKFFIHTRAPYWRIAHVFIAMIEGFVADDAVLYALAHCFVPLL
jgi:hypothetical protein